MNNQIVTEACFLCRVLIYDSDDYIMGANIDLFMHFLHIIDTKGQWNVHRMPPNVWSALHSHSP